MDRSAQVRAFRGGDLKQLVSQHRHKTKTAGTHSLDLPIELSVEVRHFRRARGYVTCNAFALLVHGHEVHRSTFIDNAWSRELEAHRPNMGDVYRPHFVIRDHVLHFAKGLKVFSTGARGGKGGG